jgi:NADH-ubiquinone oxidoreductase chain 6
LFIFLPLIISLSLLFTRLKHPLSVGLLLLVQTTIIALCAGSIRHSFWISYIIFLIFLGAILVLFIYVASLASNEKFDFKINIFFFILITWVAIFFTRYFANWFIISSHLKIQGSIVTNLNLENFNQLATSSLYEIPRAQFTLFVISYLLLTLIIIVKIINIKKLPLRTFY